MPDLNPGPLPSLMRYDIERPYPCFSITQLNNTPSGTILSSLNIYNATSTYLTYSMSYYVLILFNPYSTVAHPVITVLLRGYRGNVYCLAFKTLCCFLKHIKDPRDIFSF